MAWETKATNAWTGLNTSSLNTQTHQKRPEVSSNPWSAALKEQYDKAASSSGNPYKSQWDAAITDAQGLSGKDYTAELRGFAQEDIDTEQRNQGNQLGAIGMRELSLKADVVDDWAKRRTDASTRAAIEGQSMQLAALGALTSTISGASEAELAQISLALDAATAGAAADQEWTGMANQIFESDRDWDKKMTDEAEAKRLAEEERVKAKNAEYLAAYYARNAK